MKRIALALAAATLGTGCIVTTDGTTGGGTCLPTTLTVNWSFTDADGYARSCTQMGIDSIHLFYDGIDVGYFACGNGYQTLTDPLPGQHAILVEGVDSSTGAIIARDNYYANVANCGDSYTNANAAEGWAQLRYALAQGATCGGGSMWFAVRDDVATTDTAHPVLAAVVDAASAPAVQTAYPCSSPPIEFRLALGDYTLLWLQDVSDPTGTPVALNQQCTDVPFSVTSYGTNPSPIVTLSAVTPTSPACY